MDEFTYLTSCHEKKDVISNPRRSSGSGSGASSPLRRLFLPGLIGMVWRQICKHREEPRFSPNSFLNFLFWLGLKTGFVFNIQLHDVGGLHYVMWVQHFFGDKHCHKFNITKVLNQSRVLQTLKMSHLTTYRWKRIDLGLFRGRIRTLQIYGPPNIRVCNIYPVKASWGQINIG